MKNECSKCKHDPSPTQSKKGVLCNSTKYGNLPSGTDCWGNCVEFKAVRNKGKVEYSEIGYSRV